MEEQEGHQYFSVKCFNEVWDLIKKQDRSVDEGRIMLEMAHASLYHWLMREDRTASNVSIGLWQVSRVYSVLENGTEAMRFANDCIQISEGHSVPEFHRAYAYEAAARAAKVQGDDEQCRTFLETARSLAKQVEDEESRALLDSDFQELD
jgi:hypothetical protein